MFTAKRGKALGMCLYFINKNKFNIKMNNDSIWDSPFINENKNLFMFIFSIALFTGTIYFYFNRQTEQVTTTNNNIPQQINQPRPSKRRLTLHLTDLTNPKDPNITTFIEIFEKLSEAYDLFLIILVHENEDTNKLIEKYEPFTKFIYKHVKIFKLANSLFFKTRGHKRNGKKHRSLYSCGK
jgi:hypothetical protein